MLSLLESILGRCLLPHFDITYLKSTFLLNQYRTYTQRQQAAPCSNCNTGIEIFSSLCHHSASHCNLNLSFQKNLLNEQASKWKLTILNNSLAISAKNIHTAKKKKKTKLYGVIPFIFLKLSTFFKQTFNNNGFCLSKIIWSTNGLLLAWSSSTKIIKDIKVAALQNAHPCKRETVPHGLKGKWKNNKRLTRSGRN